MGEFSSLHAALLLLALTILLFNSLVYRDALLTNYSKGLPEVRTMEDMSDRRLLSQKKPPNVRSSGLPMFDGSRLVRALEELAERKAIKHNESNYFNVTEMNLSIDKSGTLHFAFVGDSRIRQIFASFVAAVPDSDRDIFPRDGAGHTLIPAKRIEYSSLLSLLVSFNYQPLLVDDDGNDLSDMFSVWLDPDREIGTELYRTPHPDVLLIGMSSHHMLKERKVREKAFFAHLKQLVPTLQKLSENCQVIWLGQYPTRELYGDNNSHNTDVHEAKIWRYNQEIERILRGAGIPVWSSGSPIVEEYIRSCLMNQRLDQGSVMFRNFFECDDYIHPGLSGLTDVVQLFFNMVFVD